MRTRGKRSAISRTSGVGVAIVIVVVIIIAAAVFLTRPTTSSTTPSSSQTLPSTSSSSSTIPSVVSTTTTSSTSTTASTSTSFVGLKPSNSSVLVDDSQTTAPDALDPAEGFATSDEGVFTSVFQQLVEMNGSTETQVVPVVASNYTIQNNYQTYIFTIRPGVTFSNGDPVNAYTVWFSFVRELYDGQAVGISNYAELTVNTSTLSSGLTLPWGIRQALQSTTGLPTTTSVNTTTQALNYMLSHFDYSNTTQQKIMSYPNQAYVALNSMTFEINLLNPYSFFLQDLAAWWGAIVDPAYVDAHGGVQANTPNSYFDANSGPGTGPYEIRTVAPAFSTIVLQTNPHYWALNSANVPSVAQPPRIPTIIINYALNPNSRIQAFGSNEAQISYVIVSQFNEMYQSYQYKQYGFKQIFDNLGVWPNVPSMQMNTQKYPTNNNDFRLAIVHALNYTQMVSAAYGFNGSVYGQNFVGPIDPSFKTFYNPDNLPLYSYNDSLAEYYLNLAGQQENFSVTLPNGSVLGNPNAPQLKTITLVAPAPSQGPQQILLEIMQQDLSKIGLSVGVQLVTLSVYGTWTNPQVTPNFVWILWTPDWPDPILQEMVPFITTTSFLPAWMNLSTVNQIVAYLPFVTNQTKQVQLVAKLYNITYDYAPDIWLPVPDLYYFIQPYVGGFTFNEIQGYYYNLMYYTSS
jgi:peptide/nickel transport system substrate-binding protein